MFKKLIKLPLKIIPVLIIILAVGLTARAIMDRQIDYEVDLGDTVVPGFREVDLPFSNANNGEDSLPFLASAVIDIDGDGSEELFLGGGHNQQDAFFRFDNDAFVLIDGAMGIDKVSDDASLGSVVLDFNKDGSQDLIVTRESGVWLHANRGQKFDSTKLELDLKADTTALSVAVADINNDGHFDLFVSGYIRNDLVEGLNIFNKEGYGGTSEMYINRGDNTFENQTEALGLSYKHNTFQSVLIDVDNDSDLDIIIAHDTGQVRTWRNNGAGFDLIGNPNSEVYSYPMGIAVADYDNNGLVDFFFSNVGSTPPHFLVKGDLTEEQQHNWKWLMFHNEGDFKFTDSAQSAKVADYEFAWGTIFDDFNLDGRQDLVVSQNFVSMPLHKFEALRLPGRFFVQNEQNEFAEVGEQAGIVNRQYSIAPLSADFNGDGYPDLIHANLAGGSKAFINEGGDGGYLKIQLPDTVQSIGAMVTVTREDGKKLYLPYVSGEGLCSDSSRVIIAGLGDSKATSVEVKYLDGTTVQRQGSYRNTSLKL